MSRFRYAILAVVSMLLAAAPPADEPVVLPAPLEVRFRLADGIRVSGRLTAWSEAGIDGSFGRRAWPEIDHEDIWRLYRRLHGAMDGPQWVELGGLLLDASHEQPRAAALADRAFKRAIRLDESLATEIEAMKGRAEAEAADARRRDAEAERERLATRTPEALAWGATPWPPLTDDEREAATNVMRSDAERILERAGLRIAPVETSFFLFYSDLPRRESARWANQLDAMYRRLTEVFDLPPDENVFWGKAVIFVFTDADRYRLVESESFGHLAPTWATGMCHPIGPKVFVNFYRQPDDETFAAILVHETVHGFMHRYRSPRRLPTWANEGFADYLAATLFENSPIDRERRRKGVRHVREGADVNAVMSMAYDDGTWPGRDTEGYEIGYLLVELMIRDRPRHFGRWVDAIKAGKDWEQALAEDFGVDRAKIVDTFVRYYRVND